MIDKLLNLMKLHSQMATSGVAYSRYGTITNYDPDNYKVRVIIEPQDTEDSTKSITGWLPLMSAFVGPEWGMFAPPTIGAICAVHFSEGSFLSPFVSMLGFNNKNRPLSVQSDEFWIVHKSGSFLKFTNDGNVSISSSQTVNITAETANIDAENVNLGDTSGALEALLNETAQAVYNTHTHAVSGAATLVPTQLMTSMSLTDKTRAN
jgi:uncharacterized protein involved in type VI secretion and phage assembly